MDLKICSLNVRGLGDRTKGVKFSIGLEVRNIQFICCKKFIALKPQLIPGRRSGDIKQFLVVAQARKQEWPFFLIITLAFRFTVFFLTPTEDSLSVTLRSEKKS